MREILFRGKRTNNGEWVEGYYVYRGEEYSTVDTYAHFIVGHDMCGLIWYEVIPESVSEFTGLTDKNGKKIFEGDIVDVKYNVNYVGIAAERKGLFVVVFDNGCFMKKKINGGGLYQFIGSDVCRVVGNAIYNPELLKTGLKPEYRDGDPDYPICPNCRTPLNEMEDCDCGKKIDWSEEE